MKRLWQQYMCWFVLGMLLMFFLTLLTLKRPGIEAKMPTHAPPSSKCGESSVRTIEDRPPGREEDYRKQFGEIPFSLIYVKPEERFYAYSGGSRCNWNPSRKCWQWGDPK